MKYTFNSEPSTPSFGPKPAGDYGFTVTECGDEPTLSPNNNWVLAVRLAVGHDGATVFDNPWSRSEQSSAQDGRDGIALFLIAINMAPAAGKEPDWKGCIGKKGRCRLKVEIANQGALAGKEVNKVAFYHAPAQVEMKGQTASASDFEKARQAQIKKTQQGGEPEPDLIPY